MTRNIPAREWRVVAEWLDELLVRGVPDCDGVTRRADRTLMLALAGVLRDYYARHPWSRPDAQLVAVSAYRLVMSFTDGAEYSHSTLAELCDHAYSEREVRDYFWRVWSACGAAGFDIMASIRDYRQYHLEPRAGAGDAIADAVIRGPRDSLLAYMNVAV